MPNKPISSQTAEHSVSAKRHPGHAAVKPARLRKLLSGRVGYDSFDAIGKALEAEPVVVFIPVDRAKDLYTRMVRAAFERGVGKKRIKELIARCGFSVSAAEINAALAKELGQGVDAEQVDGKRASTSSLVSDASAIAPVRIVAIPSNGDNTQPRQTESIESARFDVRPPNAFSKLTQSGRDFGPIKKSLQAFSDKSLGGK